MSPPFDVRPGLRRSAHRDEDAWLASAVDLLALLARVAGVPDLGRSAVLDMGCGTKLAKAIVERQVPVGRYVGVDTSAEVIDLLRAHVDDPRLSFHHVDVHNDLYNPGGRPLAELPGLPLGDEQFDVLCLFSVFTHLAPDDYVAMLRLLRPYARPHAHLVYSLFVNEPSGTGHGLADQGARHAAVAAAVGRQLASGDPEAEARFARGLAERLARGDAELTARLEAEVQRRADGAPAGTAPAPVAPPPGPVTPVAPAELAQRLADLDEPFVDLDPTQPLMYAVYSREHATELVEGTGWVVEDLLPPTPNVQHHLVCRPQP